MSALLELITWQYEGETVNAFYMPSERQFMRALAAHDRGEAWLLHNLKAHFNGATLADDEETALRAAA